jgi:ABC-2 type transport system permease protein
MLNVRAITGAFKQQALDFVADPQWLIPSLVAPFTFTLVTLMLFPEKNESVVLYAVLGGGILGMWSNTLRSSGFSVNYDRMNGTLEPLMMAPTPLMEVIAGRAIWNALIGLLNSVLIFVLAEFVFQSGIKLADPLSFFAALVLTLLSLSVIGLVFSAFFVFTRSSTVLMQILELPIYVVSGAMVPISMMPEWTWPISYGLAPSWGVDALQRAGGVVSGNPAGLTFLGDLLVLLAITLFYLLIAAWLFRRMDDKARLDGSLGRW